MKIAHFVKVTPGAAGLYESAREICKGQREFTTADARLIDVAGLLGLSNDGQPLENTEERGVPIADLTWAITADLHILHTGIPTLIEGKAPLLMWMHGIPEYAYYSQLMLERHTSKAYMKGKSEQQLTPFWGSWTLCAKHFLNKEYVEGCITCWPRHVPYWENYFEEVIQINHFCDLERFTPEGEIWELQNKATEDGLNILWADLWRYTAFKDPFQVIHGCAKFCRETGSKFHMFAIPNERNDDLNKLVPVVQQDGHPWNLIYHGLKDIIGDMFAYHPEIEKVYRAADLVITPSYDNTRLVLEAQACGTPVLASHGPDCQYHCRMEDPENVYNTLKIIQKHIMLNRDGIRERARSCLLYTSPSPRD